MGIHRGWDAFLYRKRNLITSLTCIAALPVILYHPRNRLGKNTARFSIHGSSTSFVVQGSSVIRLPFFVTRKPREFTPICCSQHVSLAKKLLAFHLMKPLHEITVDRKNGRKVRSGSHLYMSISKVLQTCDRSVCRTYINKGKRE